MGGPWNLGAWVQGYSSAWPQIKGFWHHGNQRLIEHCLRCQHGIVLCRSEALTQNAKGKQEETKSVEPALQVKVVGC